ncbi:uncharacterized protein LOC124671648 [Lolium rigidum]|uniref:uncharacterized protein LOC124671648 n=1 Tax=Lolium rigidum TaxID=89674 RepID=UPI001F5CFC5E|nr:uncharacterized protein LOC124671648 [Lolium rigidum]
MSAQPTSTTPPPPSSEPTATADIKPPPPPLFSAADADARPKKRKLEEVGFHQSPYYKIRAAVANLRGRFLQVCRATDFRKDDAALEILKVCYISSAPAHSPCVAEIKVVMELSKKMRLDISAAAGEPIKPLDIPAARAVQNKTAGEVPSVAKNQVPQAQIGQDAMFLHNTGGKVPLKHASSPAATMGIQRESNASEIANRTNQLGDGVKGSYVIGGSPMGWNFRMWPGGKAVYYGLSKVEWLALQAAK